MLTGRVMYDQRLTCLCWRSGYRRTDLGSDARFRSSEYIGKSTRLSLVFGDGRWTCCQLSIYESNRELAQVPGSMTRFTVVGLTESTAYEFSIAAQDAFGNLSGRLRLTVRTDDGSAPTWAPNASISVTQITETSAYLGWNEAQDANGVDRYIVQVNGNPPIVTQELNVQLEDLTPATQYEVTITAIDHANLRSAPNISARFETVDLTPPQFAANAILVLTGQTPREVRCVWQAALDNVGVAGYEIRKDGEPIANVDSNQTEYVVTNLQAGTTVNLAIIAYDAADNRSVSGPSTTFDTGDDTPPIWAENASLIISELAPSSLTLAWSGASDDVGIATYEVRQNGLTIGTTSQSSLVVSNLTPWTQYRFGVYALDAMGNRTNTELSASTQTPDNAAPNWLPGEALLAEEITAADLTLVWTPASDDVGVVTYEITQDGILIGTVSEDVLRFHVGQLSPWTSYEFLVSAIDAAGNRSVPGLIGRHRTLDVGDPYFDAGALTAEALTPNGLTLRWTPATDDVAVNNYIVTQDGVALATIDAQTLTYDVVGLLPWRTHVFSVFADDESGNRTRAYLVCR